MKYDILFMFAFGYSLSHNVNLQHAIVAVCGHQLFG